MKKLLRVGELASRTGLTVRTLHHYDEIGLLSPSCRGDSGYRLYGSKDVARLMQIVSLRQLGLSLAEIRDCLADPEQTLERTLDLHLNRLRQQIGEQQRLVERLEAVRRHLDEAAEPSVEELTETLEMMTMFEKYYTKEQLEALAERREQVGDARIQEVQAEWPRLIAEVREAMERGEDPASEHAQGLAQRWAALVREFTGGDPAIAASVRNLYQNEESMRQRSGLDPEIMAYIARANAAMNGPS